MEQTVNKGLKGGALGLISSTVIATASVAPAYSIAATLGFVVLAVGLTPVIYLGHGILHRHFHVKEVLVKDSVADEPLTT